MNTQKLKFIILLITSISINIYGNDPVKFNTSLNIYKDLSDTYGNGSLFSGDFTISKSWYGASLNFGYFHSQSTFIYNIIIEERDKTIEINLDEISYMHSSSISLLAIPFQNNWLQLHLSLGAALNSATSSQFNKVDYSYSLDQDKFIYLYKDYKLVKKTHFGYQVGLNISFYFLPKIGLQISSRIQDLSNGGTFFFVGGGLCFRF